MLTSYSAVAQEGTFDALSVWVHRRLVGCLRAELAVGSRFGPSAGTGAADQFSELIDPEQLAVVARAHPVALAVRTPLPAGPTSGCLSTSTRCCASPRLVRG